MNDKGITAPPAWLLGADAPEISTVTAEVRSDASIPFDPKDAPAFLNLQGGTRFAAFVLWHVDLAWPDAQRLQLWLTGAPAGGIAPTREEALKDFIENLVAPDPSGAPVNFASYLGTFLASDLSHAAYTTLIGLRRPLPRAVYQKAWIDGLSGASGAPWFPELRDFLRMVLAQPSSREEFMQLAQGVGDLKASRGAVPPLQNAVHPMINLLIP
jgi:hypothetical protein